METEAIVPSTRPRTSKAAATSILPAVDVFVEAANFENKHQCLLSWLFPVTMVTGDEAQ